MMKRTTTDESETAGFFARTPVLWSLERLVVGLATCAFVSLLYYPVSDATRARHHDLASSLDGHIPFIPETIWIYFPLYLGLLFTAILGVRHRDLFYRTVTSVAVASASCVVGFLLIPSTMTLPAVEADGTWTMAFLAWMQKVDVPNNTFPSQHVAISFSVAFGALAYHRRLGQVILVMASLVAISTTTTKQHYWIDTPGGIAVALLAHWIVFRWRREPELGTAARATP